MRDFVPGNYCIECGNIYQREAFAKVCICGQRGCHEPHDSCDCGCGLAIGSWLLDDGGETFCSRKCLRAFEAA